MVGGNAFRVVRLIMYSTSMIGLVLGLVVAVAYRLLVSTITDVFCFERR